MIGYNFDFGGFFGMILLVLFWVGIIVLASEQTHQWLGQS